MSWTQQTAAGQFASRNYHTSLIYNDQMWVIGGYSTGTNNDIWYSTDGQTWTQQTAAAQWQARQYHTSIVYNDKMWVIGGFTTVRVNDVWYSSNGTTWTQATSRAQFAARQSPASLDYNNKMWVIGGWTGGTGYRNNIWYSTDGISWTQQTAAAQFTGRSNHTSLVYNSKIWVIGGFDIVDYANDVWYTEAPNASSTITVSAVVSAYIVLSVSTTSTYLMPNLVSALGVAAIGSSTVSTSVSTNDSAGYTLSLQGTYGGVSSTPNLILNVASSTGSSTIAAGTDGYGANATSLQATIKATSTYNYWGQDIVGTISSTTNNLVSEESSPGSNRQTLIKIYAAADALQPPGTYQDYIILTVVGKTP